MHWEYLEHLRPEEPESLASTLKQNLCTKYGFQEKVIENIVNALSQQILNPDCSKDQDSLEGHIASRCLRFVQNNEDQQKYISFPEFVSTTSVCFPFNSQHGICI